MKLPNGEHAVVSPAKLAGYCLNLDHEVGKHKARVFVSALGLTMADAEVLRDHILQAVLHEEAIESMTDHHGTRYFVDFAMHRMGRTAWVRTCWIFEPGSPNPSLTSSYVLVRKVLP